MELARRPIADGGWSFLDLDLAEGRLTLSEHDVGGAARAFSPSGDVEHHVSVAGEEQVRLLLECLSADLGRDLVVLLDDAGVHLLAEARLERFGDGLDVMRQYRTWLEREGVAHRRYVH